MESVKDAHANMPVSDGRDPTLWLPDELMEMVFLMVPFEVLSDGRLERVCRRWKRILREMYRSSNRLMRRFLEERWAAYEAKIIEPQLVKGHTGCVDSLTVGEDGKIFSSEFSDDHRSAMIRVWSGVDDALLQTVVLNTTGAPFPFLVVLDGKIYSGNEEGIILVFSGEDGTHLRTLEGHTAKVTALAVGLDGKIYSGSRDHTIRVWSGMDGPHLKTLEGHTRDVSALAVGLDGKIFSGSWDETIRVWSGVDGAHVQTLEGHTGFVVVLAVGLDGKIYSGSSNYDDPIRVWSGVDGALLYILEGHFESVCAIVVGPDGTIYSADEIIQVWSGVDGTHLHTLERGYMYVSTLAVGLNGKLYSGLGDGTIQVW